MKTKGISAMRLSYATGKVGDYRGHAGVLLLSMASFLTIQFAMAQGGGVQWHPQVSPNAPGNGAIAGGPGDAPQHGAPLYVCRASVQGGTQPGKWVNGDCDVPFGGKEIVTKVYEVAYGPGEWRPYAGNSADLVQTGNEADGTPLYSCRVVQYKGHGNQPGKISQGACHIPYDGKEKVERGAFDALYVAGGTGHYVAMQSSGSSYPSGPPAQAHSDGGGFFGKLVANAQYQQAKQNGASNAELDAIKNGGNDDLSPKSSQTPAKSGDKPPCRMEDSGAHLENGNWVGPKCMTEPDDGHYVTDEEAKKQQAELRAKQNSQADRGAQERRAGYIESHSCMTTDGADKANELAADCEKVTSGSHKGCNIQENTCDEIRSATRKGCNGLGAEGPDWCLTRYD